MIIPKERWTSCVDPTDSTTLNDNGQFSTAGNLWQRGQIGPDYFASDRGVREDGFGLVLNPSGLVESFSIEGSRLRAGMVDDPRVASGRTFRTRQVWTNSPLYDIREQNGLGINLSVPFPDGGDRLRWDGTRTDKACVVDSPDDPVAVAASIDGSGDRFYSCHVLSIEEWKMGNHLAAMAGGVHARFSPRSPFTVMFGQGKMRVTTRTTRQLISTQQPPEKVSGHIDIRGQDIGTYWVVVHSALVDPYQGYLRTLVYRSASEDWVEVVAMNDGLGYHYASGDPRSKMFYPKLATTYAWHNDGGDRAPQNWDQRYGHLRESSYAWSGILVGSQYRLSDVMEHGTSVLAQPTPPPVEDAGLREKVALLRSEMDDLRARWELSEARWARLGSVFGED